MELIRDEEVLYRGRPSARASVGFYLRWVPVALTPAILATILHRAGSGTWLPLWKWWLISLVLVCVVIAWDGLRRASIRYTVTTERINIRRGILSRAEQSTDIDRVQNVSTDQSVLGRALNVGDVDFDTAGTDAGEASFAFHGVANPHALVTRVQHFKIERERTRGA